MEKVTITVDSAVYEFYRKVGLSAGGLPPEQVMADALFKLTGRGPLLTLSRLALPEGVVLDHIRERGCALTTALRLR